MEKLLNSRNTIKHTDLHHIFKFQHNVEVSVGVQQDSILSHIYIN